MKKNAKKFWIIFVSTVIIALLLHCVGCVPTKKGPSRMASGIAGGDNGVNQGWFCYIFDTGDPIEVEGIEMTTSISKNVYCRPNGLGGIEYVQLFPSDVQTLESPGVTGMCGQMTITGKRIDWQNWKGQWIYQTASVGHPQGLCSAAQFNYRTATPPATQRALADGRSRIGKSTPPPKSRFSSKEKNALNNVTEDPPDSGIEVTSTDLLQQQGNSGEGFPKELNNGFMAGNLTKPEQYLRYSAPYMFSFIFKTAQPEELIGRFVPVIISTNAYYQGIHINLTVIGSNSDKKTHVARTDGFLPVGSAIPIAAEVSVYERWTGFSEPNIWDANQYVRSVREDWLDVVDPNLYADPNTCPDPNVLFNPADPNFYIFTNRLDTTAVNFHAVIIPERVYSVKTIPILAANDYLDIDMDRNSPAAIMLFAENWLCAFSLFDLNNDGIVNMKDLP
jgi:hypothetical protein